MQGPAAGAESLLLDGKAAVAVAMGEEVVRRGQRSTSGCCRCSWFKAVLVTLLVSATTGALGYLLSAQQSTRDDCATNSHKCFPLQWRSDGKDYDVFTVDKHGNYHIYGWVAFAAGRGATAVLRVHSNSGNREISTQTTFKNWTMVSADVDLLKGFRVSISLRGEFTAARVCLQELPAKSK